MNPSSKQWTRYGPALGYLPFLVVLTSPVAAYLLDLRLAQTVGDRSWLDDFRVLQAVQIAAVIATTTLFPQVIVPKLSPMDRSSSVNWDAIRRMQSAMIWCLLPLLGLVLFAPETVIRLLKYHSGSDAMLWAPVRAYFACVVATASTGVNASCLLALGSDTALYLASTAPSVAAVLSIQLYQSKTTLWDVCVASLLGALVLWAYSAVALYLRSAKRIKIAIPAENRRWAGLVTKGDVQQILALLAAQSGALVLNKVLTKSEPGAVRDYNFAFKIASVGMLPCVVAANRLLKSMGVDGRGSSSGIKAMADRAAAESYLYGFSLLVTLLWAHAYVLRIVFFKARFSDSQYAQMGRVLWLLALGLPAVSQAYVWTRVNAVRGWNHFTLASSVACLAIVAVLASIQSGMGAERVAALWALAVTVQAILLIGANHYALTAGGRLDPGRPGGAVVYAGSSTAAAAAVWLAHSLPNALVPLIIGLNILLFIHFLAIGWDLLGARITGPTVPELSPEQQVDEKTCV